MKRINNKVVGIAMFLTILFLLSYVAFTIFFKENHNGKETDLVRVIDGDTFVYNGETIRLLCVQTPEVGEEGYEEAKVFLMSLIYGGELKFESIGQDKDVYNRSLRFVYSDYENQTLFVNKEIVDKGYGKIYAFNGTDCSMLN